MRAEGQAEIDFYDSFDFVGIRRFGLGVFWRRANWKKKRFVKWVW